MTCKLKINNFEWKKKYEFSIFSGNFAEMKFQTSFCIVCKNHISVLMNCVRDEEQVFIVWISFKFNISSCLFTGTSDGNCDSGTTEWLGCMSDSIDERRCRISEKSWIWHQQ